MFYGETENRLAVPFALLLGAALIEAMSVGMILPLLQGDSGSTDSTLDKALAALTDALGTGTTAILVFMVVLFFIRGAFMTARSLYQAKIISDHLVQMRTRIITAMFNARYRYLISR